MSALANGRVALATLLTALFATMVAMAATYPPNARLMPFVIGIPGLMLCLTQLVIEIKDSLNNGDDDGITFAEVRFFLWFPAFIVSVLVLGFLASTPLMVFIFLRFGQKEPTKTAAALAIGGTVVIYLIFEVILGLEMFRGFVTPLLFD